MGLIQSWSLVVCEYYAYHRIHPQKKTNKKNTPTFFNTSFFGRKLGDGCEHIVPTPPFLGFLSVLLEVFIYLFIFFFLKEKKKRTNTVTVAHLGGLMAGVVMPPRLQKPRWLYVKAIAQLISDMEIHRNVYWSAAGGVKPLCCNLTLASPSSGVSLERL